MAEIHGIKFATRGYTTRPPNTVCVSVLPCKNLSTNTDNTNNNLPHIKYTVDSDPLVTVNNGHY